MQLAPDKDMLPLAGDFPAASHAGWLKLVDKVLNGAPFDKKLVARTYDGLSIQPLYTADDWNSAGDPSGYPGAAPYTRGGRATGTAENGWDIRQVHSHPDPEVVNRQILEDLERGVTSIVLRVDPSGKNGTAVRSKADLDTALKGVLLDIAPIVFDPTGPTLPMAALFMQVLSERGLKNDAFTGSFGTDPLGALATTGTLITDIDTILARMADTTAYVAKHYPNARTLNIKTTPYHGAGCGEAQELGIAMATAVEYLRRIVSAGMDIDTAARQVAFTITTDADMILSIAKIRALRRLWGRVAEACGANEANRVAPVTAITAPRMYSKRDPWVNILRGTVACFAAGVAGADAITVLPLDYALGYPSTLARRVARNTHVVLQEESGLAKVIDPAGGAWTFEKLTDDLAVAGWAFFQKIEKAGGIAKMLLDGTLAAEIAAVREARLSNIAKRKDALTGISEFPNIHEADVVAEKADIDAVLKKRDQGPVGDAGKLPPAGKGELMAALVDAAKKGANLPAMSKGLATGTPITATALPQMRLSQDFETLRDAGDAFKAKFGARPQMFLANLGTVAEFTGRATYAKNFYEAGGIETITGTGGTDITAIAADFKRSGAPFAIVCGTDAAYATHAADLAKALKAAGAGIVHLAGRGGDLESILKSAGVDGFIYIGCDVPKVLKDVHKQLEAA